MRNALKDERGISLVEVIGSIFLVSIIIMAFISIFPQMKNTNDSTGKNLNAANAAKEILVGVKDKSYNELFPKEELRIGNSLKVDKVSYTIKSLNPIILQGIYEYLNSEKVNVRISIQKDHVPTPNIITLREMSIEILNDNNNVIAKIHGYLEE